MGPAPSNVTGVNVQLDKVRQPIQGFGLNSALMPNDKTLPMDDLYGLEGDKAIGLSILRVGMTPDGNLTGKYVAEAKSHGAKVIGSCWSPPGDCKDNGSTQNGGHVKKECYNDWADKIANFAEAQGLYAMSIANESDFASCPGNPVCTDAYDTTVYTAAEMVEWVQVAGPKLKAKNIKVIAPEASEWIHAWSNASGTGSTVASHPDSSDPLKCGCFAAAPDETGCAQTCLDGNGYDYGHWLAKNQTAWDSFDIFGVHEYDSQVAFPWPSDVNGGVRNKEVWQTEMSGVMHWPEQGPSTDINNGLAVAGWIHSALTVGEASAWLYWWYEAYFQDDNEGLGLTKGGSTIAKRYYALGQYSKFVRPEFNAVTVAGADDPNVLISAYSGADNKVVVVAINKGDSTAEFPITITGGTAPASLTPYATNAMENIKAGTAVAVADGVFTASLGAKSITSFVTE
jgi:glucuronoarabinoxylan endo-1,4-beta-xylanase